MCHFEGARSKERENQDSQSVRAYGENPFNQTQP